MSSLADIRARRQQVRERLAQTRAGGGGGGTGSEALSPDNFAGSAAVASSASSDTPAHSHGVHTTTNALAATPAAPSAAAPAASSSSALPHKRKHSPPPSHVDASSKRRAEEEQRGRLPAAAAAAASSYGSSSFSAAPAPAPVPAPSASSSVSLTALLRQRTFQERESALEANELEKLLSAPTAREIQAAQQFVVKNAQLLRQCPRRTRASCTAARRAEQLQQQAPAQTGFTPTPLRPLPPLPPCPHIHFIEDQRRNTDPTLGECSYLDSCQHMGCPKLHYKIDPADRHKVVDVPGAKAAAKSSASALITPASAALAAAAATSSASSSSSAAAVTFRPPEWLNCDIRTLDVSVLGTFSVLMMDPPWRISMSLPYETMSDDEMRNMPIAQLQDNGVCFLWVISRAQGLGRECLARWGYQFAGELLWVKMDQLSRLRRTGRTGPWLNHSMEHCLIGVKGNVSSLNRGLDCDVLLSQPRETSRKPDEMYALLERLAPGERKLEIFGRQHNTRPNWVTLGNQLNGLQVHDEAMATRIKERYGPRALEADWLGPKPPVEAASAAPSGHTHPQRRY